MVHFSVESASLAETEETKELAREAGAGMGEGGETAGALFVGRFGARAQVAEGEPVEVAVDTSALHFFDPELRVLASTTRFRKEEQREKSLGSEGRGPARRGAAGSARDREQRVECDEAHAGRLGEHQLRRRLDGRRGERLRERDQGLQQGRPGREGQLQAGRRQPADRGLHGGRRRQSARHGRHRPARAREAVRRQEGAQADRLREGRPARELHARVGRARHVQQEDLRPRLQGEQQVDGLVQRPLVQDRRRQGRRRRGPSSRASPTRSSHPASRPSRSAARTDGRSPTCSRTSTSGRRARRTTPS